VERPHPGVNMTDEAISKTLRFATRALDLATIAIESGDRKMAADQLALVNAEISRIRRVLREVKASRRSSCERQLYLE
jgi:hypothetical protein